ncbi:tRNA(Ile)-lysidine synthase [Limihaloglobus sulfuriphilus]|uniref:tRNA(Ile)-lysidine synthase n=1 Tax=Limihaloglobus sulfuriphilus TaxID=1851148 RepID=A0A1Q2MHU8_9BACT|nr:tRNA lysidine(34) synthetase TilS [Limihaloglobus sulfuriphilus]AQQ72229.1 tRNA(Ile)-lysidine synthase [Limihaloglobus sulfuriphilus]
MNPERLETAVLDFIQSGKLFADDCESVLLGVSGGLDSVCMFEIMRRLCNCGRLKLRLGVVHVNHKLRGEASDADESFVEHLCASHGVACFSFAFDVDAYARQKKISLETAGRDLRQKAFCQAGEQFGTNVAVLAHHFNDNVETVLHRLIRGCGYAGLGGISARNVFDKESLVFVRPLLGIKRRELEGYAAQLDLQWRQDHTNAEAVYTRNVIRLLLIPMLEKDFPLLSDTLNSLSVSAQRFNDALERDAAALQKRIVKEQQPDQMIIDTAKLLRLKKPHQVALLRMICRHFEDTAGEITRVHLDQMLRLAARSQSGRQIRLPGGVYVRKGQGDIMLSTSEQPVFDSEPLELEVGRVNKYGYSRIEMTFLDSFDWKTIRSHSPYEEYFDAAKITWPVRLRRRKSGDRFRPLGSRYTKKVSRFLTDQKTDLQTRRKVLIFEDQKNIIWVSPLRISSAAAVSEKTEQILKISLHWL